MLSSIKAADLMLPGRHPKDCVVDRNARNKFEPGRNLPRRKGVQAQREVTRIE